MPGHVVLTESLARKIFGRTDAVGQTFETSGYGVDGTQAVGAVVADNEGRTFREYDMLSPLNVQESEREWNAFGLTWSMYGPKNPGLWRKRSAGFTCRRRRVTGSSGLSLCARLIRWVTANLSCTLIFTLWRSR